MGASGMGASGMGASGMGASGMGASGMGASGMGSGLDLELTEVCFGTRGMYERHGERHGVRS
jgi:hypothetical protein